MKHKKCSLRKRYKQLEQNKSYKQPEKNILHDNRPQKYPIRNEVLLLQKFMGPPPSSEFLTPPALQARKDTTSRAEKRYTNQSKFAFS